MGPNRDHPAYHAGYELITTEEQLHAFVKQLGESSLIAIDTETTSINPMEAELCGISIGMKPHHGVYIPKLTALAADLCSSLTSSIGVSNTSDATAL